MCRFTCRRRRAKLGRSKKTACPCLPAGLIEARVRELAEVFAVGVYAFARMSNHFHLVLAVTPDAARAWTDGEVINRWRRGGEENSLSLSPACPQALFGR